MTDSFESARRAVASRLRFYFAGEGFSGNDDAVQKAVRRMDDAVRAVLARQTWRPGEPEHGNSEGRPMHMLALEVGVSGFYLLGPLEMAKAFRCPQSRYHNSAELLERLTASLAYFETFIAPAQERQGTWYGWDIAIPRWLTQTLVLCGEDLPSDLRDNLLAAVCATPFQLFKIVEGVGLRRSDGGPVGGGANTMEVALHLLLRTVATGDPKWADMAAEQIPVAMAMNPQGEGVQLDWSFHFHGKGANTAYGHICLASQALWIYLTRGTPWACPEQYLEMHLGTLREFFTRNAWRGRFAPFTLDRTIARPRGIYGETLEGFYLESLLLTLAGDIPPADAEVLSAAAAEWLDWRACEMEEGERPDLALGDALLRTQVAPGQSSAGASITRYYPHSEYLLVRRPQWFAAVLMNSTRTAGWKAISGEHIHGSSSAEFSVALMTDGEEWTNSTVPTMNWRRLMGVTRCDTIEASPEGYGQSTFVGALTGDEFAVLGMQYLLSPPGQDTLRGNKSLFVTSDGIVLLGSAIQCDADEPVVTTLFHAAIVEGGTYRCNGEVLDVTKNGATCLEAGATLCLRNVAIRLLEQAELLIEEREGSYNDLNNTGMDPHPDMAEDYLRVHRHRWIYLTVGHGVRPKHGRYGAVIWPGIESTLDADTAGLEIVHEELHHRVSLDGGVRGGEVRFPGDWRVPRGLSYPAAEPAQWGNLAQWQPADAHGKLRLQILPPLRYDRFPNRATEILLPDGMTTDTGPSITLGGEPWPRNVVPLMANGETMVLEVDRPAA